jgi:hypothetical protein
MTKKPAKQRNYNRTFDQFKAELSDGHYNTVVGARRGAAYLPEADKAKALGLVAKHFGVGLDEPGEMTGRRGRKKKVARKVRKTGRPSAPPANGAAAASPEPAAPKRRGRARKVRVEDTTARPSRQNNGSIADAVGAASAIVGTIDQAIRSIEWANKVADGRLDILSGLQEAVDTQVLAVKSLRRQLPPPVDGASAEEDRPTNHQAAAAAARAVGIAPEDTGPPVQ